MAKNLTDNQLLDIFNVAYNSTTYSMRQILAFNDRQEGPADERFHAHARALEIAAAKMLIEDINAIIEGTFDDD